MKEYQRKYLAVVALEEIQMNKTRRITILLTFALLTFSFFACGKEPPANFTGIPAENLTIYKVGTEPTFPPFEMVDKETKELIGFDIDFMNAIARDQGFQIEWIDMGFDGLIPSLQAGNIDIIASGMDASDDRKDKVDFSDPYYDSGQVLTVKAGNTAIQSIDDLTPEMKVGGQIGTTGADFAAELYEFGRIAEARNYDGLDVAISDLVDGTIDVLINDLPVTKAYMEKTPGTIEIAGDVLNEESYSFAVQKGDTELLSKINAGIHNLEENGTYHKLYVKWFE